MVLTLFAAKDSSKAKRILVTAAYSGITVDAPASDGKESEGKMPVLETDEGCIFSTNAIARYVARMRRDTGVYGRTFIDSGSIDGWIEFCQHELEVPLCVWVYPKLGIFEEVPAATKQAKEDVNKALSVLNKHLAANTYIVGHQVTLADITLACTLLDGFVHVMDSAFRNQYPDLMRWFNTCVAQPQFKKVLGDIVLLGDKAPAGGKGKASPKKGGKSPAKGGKSPAVAAAAPAGAAGGNDAALDKVKAEIAAKKAELKAGGMSGGQINKDPAVAALVKRMQDLKSGVAAPAAAAPSPKKGAKSPAKGGAAPAGGATYEADLEDAKAAIVAKKAELKAGGMSGGQINKDAGVKEMVAKMQDFKAKVDAGEKKPGGGKASPKKGGAAPAAPAAVDPKKLKKVEKEGGKKGSEIAGAADMGGLTFMNVSVDEPEGDCDLMAVTLANMDCDVDPLAEETKGGAGHVGKCLFSYNKDACRMLCNVPDELKEKVDAKKWMEAILKSAPKGSKTKVLSSSGQRATGEALGDGAKSLYPIKIRDELILGSLRYLQGVGVFPNCDDESSDEMIFGDDDFPS